MVRKIRARVRIQNPVPGANTFTSPKNAENLVKRGLAEWAGEGIIRFHASAEDRAEQDLKHEMRKYFSNYVPPQQN